MTFSRKTLILDCGASRTVLGVFSARAGRQRLDGHWVESFSQPEDYGERWLERTIESFRALRRQAGRGGPCVLVLPGHWVLTKFFRVPRTTAEQRQKVIQFESEQNLPIALSELVWDSVVSAERESGVEVMLAASHLRKVEALCRGAQAAGFAPRVVLPGVLALLAAFHGPSDEPASSRVVVNLGARSTTLLFLEPGRFLVRTFTFGTLPPAVGGSAPTVSDIVSRVAEEMTRTVRHFQRQHGIAEPMQVALVGGGARLEGLAEALATRLQRPVERVDPVRALAAEVDLRSAADASEPVPVELAGAVLADTRESASVINLLPPGFRREGERRRRRTLAVAAVVLVALGASLLWHFERPVKRRPAPPSAVATGRHAVEVVARPAAALVANDPESAADEVTPESEGAPPVELLDVRVEPYRLQLAGYVGEPDNYRAVFTADGLPAPFVAEGGRRLDDLEIELRKVEVRRVAIAQEAAWPAFEEAAFATLHDERTGEDVELDSRARKMTPVRAWLRTAPDAGPRPVRVGDEFELGGEWFRVTRIELDPPRVVVSSDDRDRDDLVLSPIADAGGGRHASGTLGAR